jgi:2-iminobutanoate/2-iminopropanoate deaminase
MKRKLNSNEFAERMGAYSHGYEVDLGTARMIFTTGQIGLDKNGQVVFPEDVAKQTEFVFESLQKILAEAGASLDDAVKATIYVTDMTDFAEISKVRNKYFAKSEPVSTLVQVQKLVKPGCRVEIEVVAVVTKQEQ